MLASKYSRFPKLGSQGPVVCHNCGAVAMTLKTGECHLSEGASVPDVEWLECERCGEKLFDSENVNRMLEYRRSRRITRSRSKALV